jgi:hypothetical protein
MPSTRAAKAIRRRLKIFSSHSDGTERLPNAADDSEAGDFFGDEKSA